MFHERDCFSLMRQVTDTFFLIALENMLLTQLRGVNETSDLGLLCNNNLLEINWHPKKI